MNNWNIPDPTPIPPRTPPAMKPHQSAQIRLTSPAPAGSAEPSPRPQSLLTLLSARTAEWIAEHHESNRQVITVVEPALDW